MRAARWQQPGPWPGPWAPPLRCTHTLEEPLESRLLGKGGKPPANEGRGGAGSFCLRSGESLSGENLPTEKTNKSASDVQVGVEPATWSAGFVVVLAYLVPAAAEAAARRATRRAAWPRPRPPPSWARRRRGFGGGFSLPFDGAASSPSTSATTSSCSSSTTHAHKHSTNTTTALRQAHRKSSGPARTRTALTHTRARAARTRTLAHGTLRRTRYDSPAHAALPRFTHKNCSLGSRFALGPASDPPAPSLSAGKS